jgi:hypothetical protein
MILAPFSFSFAPARSIVWLVPTRDRTGAREEERRVSEGRCAHAAWKVYMHECGADSFSWDLLLLRATWLRRAAVARWIWAEGRCVEGSTKPRGRGWV